MTGYIKTDELLDVLNSQDLADWLDKQEEYTPASIVEHALETLPTVDAIPVSFIEKQIESAEWILTHIGDSDYYGNTCEELSLKCYLLRSLINKWRDE